MDDLAKIETPEPSGRWKPIAHHLFVFTLLECLRSFGLQPTEIELGIQGPKGERLFGLIHVEAGKVRDLQALNIDSKKHTFQVGFRGANDKSLARYLIAGLGCFVCDNMCFSGDAVLLKRRQTKGLNLEADIMGSLGLYVEQTVGLLSAVKKVEQLPMEDVMAKALIAEMFNRHDALPMRMQKDVWTNYFEPQDSWEDCHPRSYDGLYNAFTRAARPLKPERKFRATQLITNLLVEQPANNPELAVNGPVELLRRASWSN